MPAFKLILGNFQTAEEAATSDRLSGMGDEPIRIVIPYTVETTSAVILDDLVTLIRHALEADVWTRRETAPILPSEDRMDRRRRINQPVTLADLWPDHAATA